MSITNVSNSTALTKQFVELFPGGHSNFRAKVDASQTKIFVNRAEGCHVWDVDDNEYIEYNGAMGPAILGHRNPEYVAALKAHLDEEATSYGSNLLYGTKDIELAKLLIKHIPCAEAVKFCVTGSEAVHLAMRIGRAYTGKRRILRFDSMYHGWFDNVVDSVYDDENAAETLPLPKETPPTDTTYTLGTSPWAKEESLIIPYNNFEILEKVFKNYHDEIAMCLVEPISADVFCVRPVEGFIERLRELCTQYNVVLCFDEIISMFRLGLGGAQAELGVIPDLTTIGKGISNGIPFSAVVGKKEVMDIFRRKSVMGAGTYNGYSLGVSACVTAIKIYERNDGEMYRKIYAVQEKLMDGMVRICKEENVPIAISEATGVFYTIFGVDKGRFKMTDLSILEQADMPFWEELRRHLQDEGVMTMFLNRWYVGAAHTMQDVDVTLKAFKKALIRTKEIRGI